MSPNLLDYWLDAWVCYILLMSIPARKTLLCAVLLLLLKHHGSHWQLLIGEIVLTGVELDAMKAVAEAYSKRSLKDFEEALKTFREQLEQDPIVHRHLSSLYDTLLEQNLCRLIEPFSRVEISHISELIGLPIDAVEKKLSQMILDKKFAGTLDQGAGCLIIFDDVKPDGIYPLTLETISNISKVVDSLYLKSAKIMA